MRAPIDRLTKERVQYKTRFTRDRVIDYISAGQQMDDDPEKLKRRNSQLCRWCHYAASRIAGQAFTDRQCGICEKEMTFSSTDTDVVCPECATKHELCQHCGADRELRPQRKTFDSELIPAPSECPGCKFNNRSHLRDCFAYRPRPVESTVILLPKREL